MENLIKSLTVFGGLLACLFSLKGRPCVDYSLFILNVEALSQGEERLYAEKDVQVTEIIDEATGEQRKHISIVCDGVGNLTCP